MKTSINHQVTCDKQKSSRWMRRLTESVAISICLSLVAVGKAMADSFSFTKMADTKSDFPSIVSAPPAINDSGTVVFVARPVGGPSNLGSIFETDEVRGVYTSDGAQITEVVNNSLLPSLFNSSNRPSQYFILREVDINDNGTVAFSVASLPDFKIGIFTNLGGALTNRSRTTYDYLMVGLSGLRLDLTLNNQDDLVYKSVVARKSAPTTSDLILSRINQPDVTIAGAGSYIGIQNEFAELGNFAFNNQGIVTFAARKGGENTKSIFISDGSSRTTLLNSTDYVSFSTNDRGDVLLSSNNSIDLLDSADGTVRTLTDTNSGLFKSFLSPALSSNVSAINNNRQVAFTATLNNGETGIFTGADPTTNKVIATGDSLLGSTVVSVGFASQGLNNYGQIAFFARLADGTEGIYRADPALETPPSQPEPNEYPLQEAIPF
ncbi:DUF7453 family protein [Iningainema tapete]|uniref:Uncharacterized protein n=1 Tax=Iningainema tapete BLCC-T55 TaxID=2748662 RepID=A0A8J6XR70_9CYAN|nr:choice-of-anchor tandem repeat NxxGxxAF-containing protein [Iningainema tapete]MBD2776860.1 hypothetical protein [Iningainema tapete BLCC-T55]